MLAEPQLESSYVSPVSPSTSGTRVATGAIVRSRQAVEAQVLFPYTCASATSWWSGSRGRWDNHFERSSA
jgi:hypothetical protein